MGAGPCRDIPLAALVNLFDAVTLNDADGSLLRVALESSELGPERARKVETTVADLTGVTERFLATVDATLAAVSGPSEAIERLSAAAERVQPLPFATGDRYDLVIASCVLTQLHLESCNRTLARFRARFPGEESRLRRSDRWFQALFGLARRMERAFLDGLTGLIAPGGRIFLSDTTRGCFLCGTPEGDWATYGSYLLTSTDRLDDYLDARFLVEQHARWHWVERPPTKPGEVGKLLEVQALILTVGPIVAVGPG